MKVVARPIEMIAWFTKDGWLSPVRFRVENEDKAYTTIKIDRIITRDMEKLAGNNMIVFRCQSLIDDVQRAYEIKYEVNSCKWILYKI